MSISGILDGFETLKKQFFHIFGTKEKIGFYRKNRRFFSDFFTSNFFFLKSFPIQLKIDFSPKNRPKKSIFLSEGDIL